jgi:hypothetical protein
MFVAHREGGRNEWLVGQVDLQCMIFLGKERMTLSIYPSIYVKQESVVDPLGKYSIQGNRDATQWSIIFMSVG